jgi:hypothetical protein
VGGGAGPRLGGGGGGGRVDGYARSKCPDDTSHLQPRNVSVSTACIQIQRSEKGSILH